LINNIINQQEPEVIKHTFKGKATTDPFEIALLRSGWQDGFDYCMENWTEGGGNFTTFPEFMQHQHGFYWNGWAEGIYSGINRHLDRLYPGAKSLSYNQKTKKYDATY
jgi:hypothetical protein